MVVVQIIAVLIGIILVTLLTLGVQVPF